MKKIVSIILCCVMVLSFAACAENDTVNTEATENVVETLSDTQKEKLEKKLKSFDGIVYVVKDDDVLYSHTNGKDELGNDFTIETPMYIGSVSKQFCATAIMMLKEQGKLSVDDTLDKYFPEYELGKKITIKNLLTMRSGIPEMIASPDMEYLKKLSNEKTKSENTEIIKEWVFSEPLDFEPDTSYAYSNTNFFLLSEIVEIVSDKPYNEFIRENIFDPLKMDNTGFVSEVEDNEFFSNSLTYDSMYDNVNGIEGLLDGLLCKGAGDVVTTAPDMDKWMTSFLDRKLISDESYIEMTTDYSSDAGHIYGYGLMGLYKKGIGHGGSIGNYVSIDYFNEEYGVKIFAVSTKDQNRINNLPMNIMDILLKD